MGTTATNLLKPNSKSNSKSIAKGSTSADRAVHLRSISSMGTAQAKMHFSSLVDMITTSERPVTITKRGKPLVRMVPVSSIAASKSIFGCMKGTAKAIGDIVGPEPDKWEALD